MFYLKALIVACGVLALSEAKHIKGIQIKNRGTEKLWVEMTDEEGFYLPSGQMASIVVEDNWIGSIRAHPQECGKKRCNLPYTEAVLKFQGEENEDKFYVSIIEGFSIPIKIEPTSINHICKSASCRANINHHCPDTHRVTNDQGKVVACKNAPELFQKHCPDAVAKEADVTKHAIPCRSNTYMITIG